MSEDDFYDDDWKRLVRQHPVVMRKIETLRCEMVSYEEFNELRNRVERLESQFSKEEKIDHDKEEFDKLFWEEFEGAKGLFGKLQKVGILRQEQYAS